MAYVVTDEEWKYLLRTETSYLTEEVVLTRCADGRARHIIGYHLTQ